MVSSTAEEFSMSIQQRHNIHIEGRGAATLVFAHGFGCDQTMWRLTAPSFQDRYRTVLYDLVGSGASDLAAYDRRKYGTLQGHADDVVQIVREVADGPVIFVGHS